MAPSHADARQVNSTAGARIFAHAQLAMMRAGTSHILLHSAPGYCFEPTKSPMQEVVGSIDISARQHLMHSTITLTEVSGIELQRSHGPIRR